MNLFKMPNRFSLTLLVALSVSGLILSADDDSETIAREDLTYGSISATIVAIDPSDRTVVLKFEDGRVEDFVAGDEIKDLSKLGVGDEVLAGYARSLGLELREPTAAELANPIEVVEQVDDGLSEAGTRNVGQVVTAITTIEVLDRINNTATLKGPLGNYLTVDIKQPEMLTKVRIGQSVMATYTEAVVLSLQKAE